MGIGDSDGVVTGGSPVTGSLVPSDIQHIRQFLYLNRVSITELLARPAGVPPPSWPSYLIRGYLVDEWRSFDVIARSPPPVVQRRGT